MELLANPCENYYDIALNIEGLYSNNEYQEMLNVISFLRRMEYKGVPSITQYNFYKNILNEYKKKLVLELQHKKNLNKLIKIEFDFNKNYKKMFINIIGRIKLHQPIPDNYKQKLEYYFDMYKLSAKDHVKYFEIIRLYNLKLKDKYLTKANYKYEILNLLQFGAELIDEDEYDYDDKSIKIINTIENIISYDSPSEIIESLKIMVPDNYELEEILAKILNNINDKIIEIYELIQEKDIYINEKDRVEIVNWYNNLIDIYTSLRKLYNEKRGQNK